MGAYVQTLAPTCTVAGEERSDCSRCDHFETRELVAGHTEEEISAVKATCTTDGSTAGIKCSVCKEVLTAPEVIPAGHKNGDDGVTCTVCGKVNYVLVNGNAATVKDNPGKWYYSFGNGYNFASDPTYIDGAIIVAINNLAESGTTNQLRFQPAFEVGTKYTITFTINLSAEGKIHYGTTNDNRKAKDFGEGETVTFTWTNAVDENTYFFINVTPDNRTAPITMTVTNIKVELHTHTEEIIAG
jgi:hypothetical protein